MLGLKWLMRGAALRETARDQRQGFGDVASALSSAPQCGMNSGQDTFLLCEPKVSCSVFL